MQLFEKVLTLEYTTGEFVDIRLPSIMQAEELKCRYKELLEMGEEEGISDQQFEEAYARIKKFRRKVNQVLALVGIEGHKLSGDMICTLLFPHEIDGMVKLRGALIEFVFGARHKDEVSEIPREEVDIVAEVFGELWAATNDWNEVVEILNSVSFEDLGKIMEHRNKALMPPEEKAKKQQQESSKKLMENLKAGKLKGMKPEQKTEELSEEEISKFF